MSVTDVVADDLESNKGQANSQAKVAVLFHAQFVYSTQYSVPSKLLPVYHVQYLNSTRYSRVESITLLPVRYEPSTKQYCRLMLEPACYDTTLVTQCTDAELWKRFKVHTLMEKYSRA